jgi:hypothetical protein
MDNITPGELWAAVLAAASAVVLLSNAGKAIGAAWKAAKAPNDEQNARIEALEDFKEDVEAWKEEMEKKLKADHDGQQASFQALLALLDHGIDGNNIEQMQDAKKVLQGHLIHR